MLAGLLSRAGSRWFVPRRGELVADALGGDLALDLGKRQEHVEREPPHAGGRVER
jgi:hypothetical protein